MINSNFNSKNVSDLLKKFNLNEKTTNIINDQISFAMDASPIQNLSKKMSINFINELCDNLYGKFCCSLTEQRASNKIYQTHCHELNQALGNGFHSGGIYEINGPSLSGKTTLINSIIEKNKRNSKILFIDLLGNNLFTTNSNKKYTNITHVTNIFLITDLINYLKKERDNPSSYGLILLDSITIILGKEMKCDEGIVLELVKVLNDLALKNQSCIIYTSIVRRYKESEMFDVKNKQIIHLKENDTLLPNQFLPVKSAEISLYPLLKGNNNNKSNENVLNNKLIFAKVYSSYNTANNYINTYFELSHP